MHGCPCTAMHRGSRSILGRWAVLRCWGLFACAAVRCEGAPRGRVAAESVGRLGSMVTAAAGVSLKTLKTLLLAAPEISLSSKLSVRAKQ